MSRKTIWYKKVTLGTVQNKDLQTILSSALSRLKTTGQRLRRPSGTESGSFELINGHEKRYGMLCGHFISFEQGHRQPLLSGLDTAQSFDLDAIAPPKGKGDERREFLEGVAYFAILKNHLILCQSKAVTSKEFEKYLNWLLWDATNILPKPTAIVLGDQPSKRIMEKLDKNPVKSVRFGTPLEFESVAVNETRTRFNEVKVSPKGLGADVLHALFSGSIFDKASFAKAVEEDNIEVEVTVRFKHKQQISRSGENLLRTVAKAARHMDGNDVQIELHKAGTIRGNDLRIHTAVDTSQTDSGLILEDDLNQKMSIWLQDLLDTKMIDP